MPGALLERVTYILDVLFHFLNTNLVLSKHETANSKPMRNTFEDVLLKLKLSIVTRKCRKNRGLFKTNRYFVLCLFVFLFDKRAIQRSISILSFTRLL